MWIISSTRVFLLPTSNSVKFLQNQLNNHNITSIPQRPLKDGLRLRFRTVCPQIRRQYNDKLTRNPRVLSGSALDALKEFYADRDARLQKFEDLKTVAEADADASAAPKVLSMDAFAEDWNESQFWVRVTGSLIPFLKEVFEIGAEEVEGVNRD